MTASKSNVEKGPKKQSIEHWAVQ